MIPRVSLLTAVLTAILSAVFVNGQSISITKDNIYVNIFPEGEIYKILLFANNGDTLVLSGEIAAGLDASSAIPCTDSLNCLLFGDVRLQVETQIESGVTLVWSTDDTSKELTDCFHLNKTDIHWFGGPERYHQVWPLEKLQLTNFANVPQRGDSGAITEPYWLNSKGAYIFIDRTTPLFINQNSLRDDEVCLTAKIKVPYYGRSNVLLKYTIASVDNPRESHRHAVGNFLGSPTGHPNPDIVANPIWSTWARYKQPINDSILNAFATEIKSYGYTGQFEIDDDWETCYGSKTFKEVEFGEITKTVSSIKEMGFTVSLWVHPFVNTDCVEVVNIPESYYVTSTDGNNLTTWWNSGLLGAHHIDFTNADAQIWYYNGLTELQSKHGIDSFKFDAGEIDWAPELAVLHGDSNLFPTILTSSYVRTCARLGDLIEVRSGYHTQDLPVFVRMIDKDSRWGGNNGLQTLIPTLLQMNMNGYSMVLPDMVGGNGYGESPTAELFVRWLQANTFMPSIQFSYVPWDYLDSNIDVIEISKKYVALHEYFTSEILTAMYHRITLGYPVNAPVWWVDVESYGFAIDDQYLLGEDILVAPVVVDSAITRAIFIPSGTWIDGNSGEEITGSVTLANYPADITILPYFLRKDSVAHNVWINRPNGL